MITGPTRERALDRRGDDAAAAPALDLGEAGTVPMPPVYGDSRLVSSPAVSDRFQSVHGLAAVSSPGSHSAFR